MRPMDDAAVRTAVEKVAARFAGMAMRSREDACSYCFGADEVTVLCDASRPLDLRLATRAAGKFDHFGDQAGVMRRVLPVVVAGIASDAGVDGDYAMRGLALADWLEWPPSMVAPVTEFLRAWFRWSLRDGTGEGRAHLVFEACAVATQSVAPWIALWEADRGPAADVRLGYAAWWWLDGLLRGRDVVEFDRAGGMSDALCAWLAGAAADRVGAGGAPAELVRRMRLLALPAADRLADEHWVTAVDLPHPREWAAGAGR